MAPSSTFAVYHTAGKFEVLPASAQAIFGEYVEDGFNHGRKVYRRKPKEMQYGLPEVVLFFWDDRDGKELSGWWFGDQIGGGQVWSRCISSAISPPSKGWRCPVDGPIQQHVVCQPLRKQADDEPGNGSKVKREFHPSADTTAPPAKKPNTKVENLVLVSQLGKDASEKTQALLGEYVQQGFNHTKMTFLKKEDGGDQVWLYYWDARDGKEASGWWIGRSVGGTEVFAVASQHTPLPPIRGWKIPHDGQVASDVSLLPKTRQEEVQIPEGERVEKVKEMVVKVQSEAEKAVKTAKSVLDTKGDIFEEGVRAISQMLQAKIEELESTKASTKRHSLAAKKQGGSEGTEAELSLLEERLGVTLGHAQTEMARAKEVIDKIEQEASEERDTKLITTRLPKVMELVAKAEMAMENATTDEAATRAKDLVEKARKEVGKTLEDARNFAPNAQRIAIKEFGSLGDRCEATRKTLSIWDATSSRKDATAGFGAQDMDEDGEEENAAMEQDEGGNDADGLTRVKNAIAEVEHKAKLALETVAVVMQDTSDVTGTEMCLDLLQDNYQAVVKAQKLLFQEQSAARRKSASAATTEALETLGPRIQVVRAHVVQELEKAKKITAKAQKTAMEEEREAVSVESVMPAVLDAEESVEKVCLEADAMKTGEEDGEEAQRAADAAQKAVQQAQENISLARTGLEVQIQAARKLPAEQQKAAFSEIGPVRNRLLAAQKKLNPYKSARAEYDTNVQAKDELEELSIKFKVVETEISEVQGVFASFPISEDEVQAAEGQVKTTLARLTKLMQIVQAKSRGTKGAIKDKLAGLQERGVVAKEKLEELKVLAVSQKMKVMGHGLTHQAEEEVKKIEEWHGQIAEAQAPWADGSEVPPEAIAKQALEACEAVTVEAAPAVAAAKTLLKEKLIEVKQLPQGMLRFKTEETLQNLQARVDAIALEVTQLKIDTFARRTRMQMTDVIEAIIKAEAEVEKVAAVAKPFEGDNLETVTAVKMKEASKKISACEAKGTKACAEARRVLELKQKSAQNRQSPSFHTQLQKLEKRLALVEGSMFGYKAAATDTEKNQKLVKAQKSELEALGKTISQVELLTLPSGDEGRSDKDDETKSLSVQQAKQALAAWRAAAVALEANPHQGLKLVMGRLLKESEKLQNMLDGVIVATRVWREPAMCRILVREGREKLKKAEQAMAKADEAEGPFLKGIEVLSPAQSKETIAKCEAAAAAAQTVLDQVRSALTANSKEASSFKCSDESSKTHISTLSDLVQRVGAIAEKLSVYRSDMEKRKKTASSADKKK